MVLQFVFPGLTITLRAVGQGYWLMLVLIVFFSCMIIKPVPKINKFLKILQSHYQSSANLVEFNTNQLEYDT